jgi:hypothetical protein
MVLLRRHLSPRNRGGRLVGMTRRTLTLVTIGALLALSGATSSARGNGAEFFEAENDGKIVLYYFGNVRDTKGAALENIRVTIHAKNADLTFPFRGDQPGHYRSIDVGKAIEASGKSVDPAQITVTVAKPGYRVVTAPRVPNKMGAVQLEAFVLEAVPGGK